MKLSHKKTNKVYNCEKIENGTVSVRTNCEAFPHECYDFDEDETSHDGHTQYYVEEPLSEFEIIKDK